MYKISGVLVLVLMLAVSGCGGCGRSSYPPNISAKDAGKGAGSDFHGIFSNSVFGSSSIHIEPTVCAGRATLQQGESTVTDSCFTGDTNIVLCTNVTGLNPVRCTPRPGSLSIVGIGDDQVSYARVK